ncbi:hypothetical protein U1Q18_020234 [Sarracenia purpurea var. burkii]
MKARGMRSLSRITHPRHRIRSDRGGTGRSLGLPALYMLIGTLTGTGNAKSLPDYTSKCQNLIHKWVECEVSPAPRPPRPRPRPPPRPPPPHCHP